MSGELAGRRLVVDAMNVVGARPTGWWRDRDAAVRRLAARLHALQGSAQDVLLVVDGRPIPGLPPGDHGAVTVRYAPRPGPDAADARIVEIVREDADPDSLTVVTSDRDLRAQVTALGARVMGAGTFLRHLDRLADAG